MELVRFTSGRGFSVRSILTFVLTVLLTALLWATAVTQPTQAQAGNVTWKGESLIYNGLQYFPVSPNQETEGLNRDAAGTYYLAIETTSERPLVRKAHVIYFAPGTSPPEATSAQYTVYDYSSDEVFSNPQGQTDITVTKQGEESSYSSCSVDGIGWIICPITVFLADSMDSIFSFVAQFVEVEPVKVNDPNSPLFHAWNIMRSFANVAFIIAFLIIIYSQLTSIGISNYGLKKLLPRLIIAAILVNISFYIAAIGVDLSNVAGYSLQNILISIREETFSITNDTWSAETNQWAAITGFILSGGAAAAGFAGIATVTGGSVAAALYLLVPILIGVLLTALFVLLVLAARQAIIVILIVIAPLAFVAYLLPNTEKWFDKWKDLFISMLVFFPAFALIFGGSQLAGGIIIENANNILMMLFGMAVQVAPLIITPLIIKLSGGLLGRIAGLINDPRRGAMDRAKNWSKDRANLHRQKSLSDISRSGRVNPFRRTAQWFDDNQRNMKERTADYEARSENRYLATERHARVNEDKHVTETDRKIIEGRLARDLNVKMATDEHHFAHQLEAANMTQASDITKKYLDRTLNDARSGYTPTIKAPSAHTQSLVSEAQQLARASAAHSAAMTASESAAQEMIARSFNVADPGPGKDRSEYLASQALLQIAGGVQGERGVARAQANAQAALEKIRSESLSSSVQLLQHRAINVEKAQPKDFAVEILKDRAGDNKMNVSDEMIRAALEIAGDEAQIPTLRLVRKMGDKFNQQDVTEMITRKASIMKSKGAYDLWADTKLIGATDEVMDASIASTLGSTAAEQFPGLKAGEIATNAGRIKDIIKHSKTVKKSDNEFAEKYHKDAMAGLRNTYFNLTRAFRNPEIVDAMGDNLAPALDIHKALHAEFGEAGNAIEYDVLDPRKKHGGTAKTSATPPPSAGSPDDTMFLP